MHSERIGNEEALENDADNSHNKVSSATELATITAILNGEQHRFHDLIRPYVRGAYAIALRLLKNEADAEDATQEAFLSAFCYLRRFRGESRFSTWLYAILLNESRARLRRTATVRLESLDLAPWNTGHVGLLLADPADNPGSRFSIAMRHALCSIALLEHFHRFIVKSFTSEKRNVCRSVRPLTYLQSLPRQ